jgi:hypothetical protein
VRLFSQQEKTFSQVEVRFSFDERQGQFIVVDSAKLSPNDGAWEINRARAALFCGLAVLRDLSPGLKPTMTHVIMADGEPKPGRLLTDQRARATFDRSRRYLRIRANDGSPYMMSPHDDPFASLSSEEEFARFMALNQYLPMMREKSYALAACRQVANFHGRREEYQGCAAVIEEVRKRMGDGDWSAKRTAEWDIELAKMLACAYGYIDGRHGEGRILWDACTEAAGQKE